MLPDELFDDPPEEDEPLLPELAAPAPLEEAAFELLVEESLAGLLPELSDDAPDWLPEASLEPALASPPVAASEPATGTAASLVLAPPLPLLRKSVTYHPEPFN